MSPTSPVHPAATSRSVHGLGALLGLAAVIAPAAAVRRPSVASEVLAGSGLVLAGAVYPLARRSPSAGAESAREMAGLLAMGLTTALAARFNPVDSRRVLGIGWALHAAFDAYHHPGPGSQVPAWYPAACAAFDLVMAGALVAPARKP